ncbi:hypothetical protein [Williamsia sterculiae]|nr:hypothetical protein [Williamsia sterculiae]
MTHSDDAAADAGDTAQTGDAQAAPDNQPADSVRVPPQTVKAINGYLSRHGGMATAVIQPIGASGVRITLVAGDGGILGDQVVDDVATAEAVVARVPDLEVGEWDRELTSVATPAPGHWTKMAGWVARTR